MHVFLQEEVILLTKGYFLILSRPRVNTASFSSSSYSNFSKVSRIENGEADLCGRIGLRSLDFIRFGKFIYTIRYFGLGRKMTAQTVYSETMIAFAKPCTRKLDIF